jgi:hypothetical protein
LIGKNPKDLRNNCSREAQMNNEAKWVLIKGSSEVSIEKDGKVYRQPFDSGIISGEIVDKSLSKHGLSGSTPQYIQSQIINNINTVERYVDENPTIEREHSFEFNLKIFKYRYTRKTTKSE